MKYEYTHFTVKENETFFSVTYKRSGQVGVACCTVGY